ncbi:3-carboxymuconate cyclase [Labedella populi]|uniref:3-carboxymuconate cyclase n=1 Tax=Labedella populi TaxID=2498850 RepID=A0A3S4CEV2_9MICO|nr:beta-propeller fold lactonase family protein [Labedella populi]RWZ68338.1 3-carboxymuconate cyclase [Labedella populi]
MDDNAVAFWLGSYTPGADGTGKGTGVGVRALGREESGGLVPIAHVESDSPSWVVQHLVLPVVYAAEEFSGFVVAFAASHDGTLTRLGEPVPVGGIVCHLSVSARGGALIASCYGDGRVVVLPLAPDGRLAGGTVELETTADPYAVPTSATLSRGGLLLPPSVTEPVAPAMTDVEPRQSRAHTSRWLADGRVVTTDLGFDLVRFWRRSPSASAPLVLDHEVTLPRGVGPRHLTWHESGHLHVVTEYSIEVFTLRAGEDGRFSVIAGVEATADGAQDGDSAAELTVVGSREHLHASVRGSNRISTLQIRGDGSELRAIGDVDSGGDHPRHHVEDGGVLHVANQTSGTIDSFEIDEWTGIPARRVGRVEVGSPTCLAPARP